MILEEERLKKESEQKRQNIDEAERRRHEGVDDEEVIDELFKDIIGEPGVGGMDGQGPSRFMVSVELLLLLRNTIM